MVSSSSSVPPERQIAALVRSARREKGWSQERLAARAGLSRQTISTLERDGTGTISTLLAVLSVLGVSAFPVGASSRDLVTSTSGSSTHHADIEEMRRHVSNAAQQLGQLDSLLRKRVGLDDAKSDSKRSVSSRRGRVNEQEGNRFLKNFGDLDQGEQMEFLRDMFAQIRTGGDVVDARVSLQEKVQLPTAGARSVARRRR
jgi:transcriptional regulator with XRE-family HTH domain